MLNNQIEAEPHLSLAIKRGKRGGFVCVLGGSPSGEVDTACSRAPETAEWFAKVFYETFAEYPYVPVAYVPQQPQVQPAYPHEGPRPPDIPEVGRFPNIVEDRKLDDPTLASRLGKRMNSIAVLTIACIISGRALLGA